MSESKKGVNAGAVQKNQAIRLILPTMELWQCSSIHQSVYGDNGESPQKNEHLAVAAVNCTKPFLKR